MKAAGKDGSQHGAFAADTGTEDGLAFVEQDGGNGIVDAAAEGGRAETGGQSRKITEHTEQFQAESLAGLFL